jgi:hypothetical protein
MPCETVEYRQCTLAACEADADCASGMVCVAYEAGVCSSGGAEMVPSPDCAPDSPDCAPPPPAEEPECTTTTYHQCAPRYVLPCEVAADCGEGFECVDVEVCEGGGSLPPETGVAGASSDPGDGGAASTPDESDPKASTGGVANGGASSTPPDGDAAPPGGADGSGASGAPPPAAGGDSGGDPDPGTAPTDPVEPECKPTGVKQCQVIEQTCTSDADCPTDWSCVMDDPPPCIAPEEGGDPDCGSTTESRSLCVPPYSDLVGYPGAGGGDEDSGEVPPGVPEQPPEPGAAGAPAERPAATGGSTGGPSNPPSSGGTTGSEVPNAVGYNDDADGSAAEDDGSCSFGASSAGPRGVGLAALGLLLLARRRRSR